MSKFFIAAALGLGLLSAGPAANAATALRVDAHAEVTPVHYQGGHHGRHYAPPRRHHHHHYAPPPRHYGWHAPVHRPHRQYGWR
ncbi:hypothetical protein EJV46_19890 [Roseococcus sp. SYP-B2431]|uniref:hypothetical protein n=1 Tax=Roseococcus sp. SYP-B2431 TaxID=2496640 RepID=UPI001040C092|nr:hypothetical protein [Roseococcus sp. SYP-B2431]TCH96833.1 hypothetical protein EJV46_19890 [Roseococcus sp. SYP-B2431]